MFKNASSGGNGWLVLDTLRGLGTSSQDRLWLDWNEAENAGGSGANYVTTTSTSFQPVQNNTEFNENNSNLENVVLCLIFLIKKLDLGLNP